jgi:hypothetical protein
MSVPRKLVAILGNMSFAAKILVASIVVTPMVVSAASANDSTIPCKAPPDKGANVAVHAGTQVTTTQDNQEKTCTFAINGAIATSPPAQQVISALNTFRDPAKRFLQEPEVAISALAALLVAPSPVPEVPSEVVQLLRNSRETLSRCLDFFYGKSPEEKTNRFSCKSFEPYTSSGAKAEMLRSTGVAVDVRTLSISLEWNDRRFVSTVWIPQIIIGLPPLRLP